MEKIGGFFQKGLEQTAYARSQFSQHGKDDDNECPRLENVKYKDNHSTDSELPKLEYLTVMDWIILISYVYATIPNFLL